MKINNLILRIILIFIFHTCFENICYSQKPLDNVKQPFYLDVNKPIEKRVLNLISLLNLEEKAKLLNHRGPIVTRFNIQSDGWNNGWRFIIKKY